ncbi:GNAT family N-acetyltransferase [Cohnella caldifontis]|uniref:GNAT family N-acetyltransferase n=1 Tax=Cohnella caldifontis TaxID=3027471 RepID=UPI0023ED83D6|nr:GNAT family N-acetyltransferase [Cohnella sp. YIM B05605]
MIAGSYRVRKLSTAEEAGKIVDFFFSPDSFDDTRHTPGEMEHFRSLPYQALQGETVFWYVTDDSGNVIGVNSVAQNEQQTGGYSWDYIAVHRDYRKSGLASALIEEMLRYMESIPARYLITYTCSLPEYDAIRRLFARNGFREVGRLPDYYFDGEDRMIYYRKIS